MENTAQLAILCLQCNYKLSEDEKFCPICGLKTTNSRKVVVNVKESKTVHLTILLVFNYITVGILALQAIDLFNPVRFQNAGFSDSYWNPFPGVIIGAFAIGLLILTYFLAEYDDQARKIYSGLVILSLLYSIIVQAFVSFILFYFLWVLNFHKKTVHLFISSKKSEEYEE